MPFPILSFIVAPDSRTIVFVTTEPAGTASVPVIYSIQDDGRRLTRVTSGQPPNEGGEGGPGGGGGFGGGISDLQIARWPLSFSVSVMAFIPVPLGAGGAGAGAGAGAAAAAGTGREGRQTQNQLQRPCSRRSSRRMGGDVRRWLADDEVSFLRSEDARDGLGRHARQVSSSR